MPGEMRYFRPRSTAVGAHTQEMLQRDRRREMRCLAPAIRRVALKRSTEKTRMAAAYIVYYYYLARARVRDTAAATAEKGRACSAWLPQRRGSRRRWNKAPLISAYAIDGRDGFYHALSALV